MRYFILGATEAHDEQGQDIPLRGARLRALLAALALRPGRTAAVTDLVADVWADDPPQDSPAALQALVGRLRRALGKEAVASAPGGYRLAAGRADVDLYEFERLGREGAALLAAGDPGAAARTLREALALWRGPALADLPAGAGGHDPGVRPEAQRFGVLRQRIEADLRRGAWAGLVPELEALTASHPYDEPLHAQFIRALRAEGRGADALAAYEQTRRTLAEGLGTDPGAELTALHAELLAGTPAQGAGPQPEGWQGKQLEQREQREGGGPRERGADAAPAAPAAGTAPGAAAQQLTGAAAQQLTGAAAQQLTGAAAQRLTGAATEPLPGADPAPTGQQDAASGSLEGRPEAAPAAVPLSASAGAPDPDPDPDPAPFTGGNIRPRLTSFVGREEDIRVIRSDLARARLVTLLGPGGSGKTRLAEEAAPPGAWLVELAPLDHPSEVPGAVLSALGLRETQLGTREDRAAMRQDTTELLAEHLGGRQLLLVLDNCEHVVGAAAEVAEALLTRCPGLTVLATSREPLGVPGEVLRPVGPLAPDAAFRLFAERGQRVRPGFAAGVEEAAVAEICRRLDCLPLALELAAARLRALSPRQIAERLDDRFRLLSRGSRTVQPRQQTLRAVVDWSWDLLDGDERAVLRRLSVFAGGWDLAAAEAVCHGTSDVPALLGALVDKSLVVAAPDADGGMRYRMLETIHEYATERAAEQPAVRADAERAHSAYFTALAARAEPLLRSAGQLPWIRRLETELDNIRAVQDRAVTAGDERAAQRLLFAVAWFWWLRNYRAEALRRIEQVIALGPEPAGEDDPRFWPYRSLQLLHLFVLGENGGMERIRSDPQHLDTARRLIKTFDRPGPHSAHFPGLIWGMLLFFVARDDEIDIRRVLEEGLDNVRRYGGEWELAVLLMGRTHVLVDLPGGIDEIDASLGELRELSARVGDRWILAQVASATAEAAMARGQLDAAREAYEESLRYSREVGAHAEAPFLLARLAELSYRAADEDAAREGLAVAERAAQRSHVRDAEAFVELLRCMLALGRQDLAEARRAVDAARAAALIGTPPPQFAFVAGVLDARIDSYGAAGPRAAARSLAPALEAANAGRFTGALVAQVAEAAAPMLVRAGEPAVAVRILAASEVWRGDIPRSVPEVREADATQTAARAALGPARYAREHAAGVHLTPQQVADELASLSEVQSPAVQPSGVQSPAVQPSGVQPSDV